MTNWNDVRSVRAWLRTVSVMIRSQADALKTFATSVDSDLPPLPEGAVDEPPPPGQMVRVCMLCSKTEEETRIAHGPSKIPFAGICESCTRIACGELPGLTLAANEPTDTDEPSTHMNSAAQRINSAF